MNKETIDELRGFDLRIIQPRDGYRFSLDPLLLCDFAGVREGERVIDLGTGSGVIPLVLARRCDSASLVGVELQEEMAGLARRNVELNGLADRVDIIPTDILSLRERFPVSSFDLVVANPPYRKPGTGRISPRAGRDLARHESTATMADFLEVAKYLVKPTGRICLVYHVSRLAECLAEAERQRLAAARLLLVHGARETEARMFLVELLKGRRRELRVLPPAYVRDTASPAKPGRKHPDVPRRQEP
ncbi:MAG TPA: methyltransferase [Geobacteraceae bacterium]|nr:methyltransferase [Geobacteraceae bacterium]